MRNCLIIFALLVVTSNLFSQVSNYYWGKIIGETTYTIVNPNGKVVDKNGNIYVLGNFTSASPIYSFLLPLVPLTTNSLGSTDGFIMKYDKDGVLQWYSLMRGGGADDYVSACLDSNDNLIAYGFTGNVAPLATISNGTILQDYSLTSDDYYRAFIAKFSKLDGHIIGSVKYIAKGLNQPSGSTQLISPSVINIFNDTIVIAGIFKGLNIDFGINVLNSTVSGSPSTVKYDVFLETLDANFNTISLKQFQGGGTGATTSRFTSINKTSNGYYFGGNLFGSTATSPAPLTLPVNGYLQTFESTSINKHDIFIYYTDLSFNGKWLVRTIGTSSNDNKQISNAFIDNTEDLTIVGYNSASKYKLSKTIGGGVFSDLTPDLSNYGVSGTSDIILFKFNESGNLLLNKQIGNSYDQKTFDYALSNDKIAIGGYFLTSLVLGKDTLSSATQDGFLLTLNKSDWSEVGALQFKGTKKETNSLISYNNSNLNYVYGTMETTTNTVTLNTSLGNNVLSNGASYQKSVFLANACPIIGFFEDASTNYFLDPSNPNRSLAITVKGDVPGGYSYSWSDGATSSSRSGLVEGNYTLTTKYLNNKCSKQRVFSFKNSIKEGTVTATNPTNCSPANGSIYAEATDVSGTNGVIQFSVDSISWNDGTSMPANKYNYTFSGLSDGVYQLYYRFKNVGIHDRLKGSVKTINYASNPITGVTTTVTPVACHGESNGKIIINTTSTSSNLNYSISGDFPGSYKIFNNFPGLPAQQCDIWVKDLTSGCKYRGTTVNLTDAPVMTPTAGGCYSSETNTGGILVTVAGGISPFHYQLYASDGSTTIGASQLSNQFTVSSPFPTSYYVDVTDANGCVKRTNLVTIDVTAPTLIDFTALTIGSLCGVIPGRISVSATGGTGSYSYKLNAGTAQNQNTFENLTNGTYTVTLIDAAGCSLTKAAPAVANISPIPVSYFKANK